MSTCEPAKILLHVGCGHRRNRAARYCPKRFRQPNWREVRLDLATEVDPDVAADIQHLPIASEAVDGIWASHVIEHVYAHEVVQTLVECLRVLRNGGELCLVTPDIQAVATYIASGDLEAVLWKSPLGPIRPVDIIYGHRLSIKAGDSGMAHKSGVSADVLGSLLVRVGFKNTRIARVLSRLELHASTYRLPSDDRSGYSVQEIGELPAITEDSVV